MIREQFQGVYSALMAPYDRKGKVNFNMIERLVDAQGKAELKGFYLCGSSGEGLLLREEERIDIVKAVVNTVGKNKKIIVHVGHPSTEVSVYLAKEAEKAGVHAISSIPPIYYKIGEDGIFKHYKMISTSTGLPFFAYIIPSLTGFNVSIELAKKLSQIKNFAGFKYTAFDLFRIPSMLKLIGKRGVIFTGSDELSFQGLTFGAAGSIGTNQNIIPSAFVEIYNLFKSGKMQEAMRLQIEVDEVTLFLLSFNKGMVPHKFMMKLLGFDIGSSRKPLERLTSNERGKICSFFKNNQIIRRYGLNK